MASHAGRRWSAAAGERDRARQRRGGLDLIAPAAGVEPVVGSSLSCSRLVRPATGPSGDVEVAVLSLPGGHDRSRSRAAPSARPRRSRGGAQGSSPARTRGRTRAASAAVAAALERTAGRWSRCSRSGWLSSEAASTFPPLKNWCRRNAKTGNPASLTWLPRIRASWRAAVQRSTSTPGRLGRKRPPRPPPAQRPRNAAT